MNGDYVWKRNQVYDDVRICHITSVMSVMNENKRSTISLRLLSIWSLN